MEQDQIIEYLLDVFHQHDLEVVGQEGKRIHLAMEYTVEVERKSLYKLLQGGQVVAPFADAESLCSFIKMDMELHEKS